MKIYLLEKENNKLLYDYLKKKHKMIDEVNIYKANVVIVNKVYNIKRGLEIIDFALNNGIEIICIKNNFAKEHYVSNYLIKDGATYI